MYAYNIIYADQIPYRYCTQDPLSHCMQDYFCYCISADGGSSNLLRVRRAQADGPFTVYNLAKPSISNSAILLVLLEI